MRRHQAWLTELSANIGNSLLPHRNLMKGNCCAQIASRDHDRISRTNDFVDIFKRRLGLDFGDNQAMGVLFSQDISAIVNNIRRLDKRQGNIIHMLLDSKIDVCHRMASTNSREHTILQRVLVLPGVHEITLPSNHNGGSRFQCPTDTHLTNSIRLGYFLHQHLHGLGARIDLNQVPRGHHIDKAIIRHFRYPLLIRSLMPYGQCKRITLL
mmetsp:Transcript_22496/g.38834  ORF Transcript_22496/g.38834 Transcript_22496/m.38834 type:complete len:211 (+) Transcript_22496:499-1131(+)